MILQFPGIDGQWCVVLNQGVVSIAIVSSTIYWRSYLKEENEEGTQQLQCRSATK